MTTRCWPRWKAAWSRPPSPSCRSAGRRCSGTPRSRASPRPRSVRCSGMAPGAVSSLAFRAREGLREAYLQAHLAETAAEQCRTTVERLGAWTRGGLSKREKAQVDAHLETCDRCRALAAELEEVNTGLRGLLAPLLLGGAAAGYLATLGPVAPLAAPGTLAAGAAASGGAGSRRGRPLAAAPPAAQGPAVPPAAEAPLVRARPVRPAGPPRPPPGLPRSPPARLWWRPGPSVPRPTPTRQAGGSAPVAPGRPAEWPPRVALRPAGRGSRRRRSRGRRPRGRDRQHGRRWPGGRRRGGAGRRRRGRGLRGVR